jgi:hypothetical protein
MKHSGCRNVAANFTSWQQAGQGEGGQVFHGLHRGSIQSESYRLGPIGAVLGFVSGAVVGCSAWLGLGCIEV